MSNNPESKSIEQLMAEADELIRQINTDAIKDMEESYRLEFEKHAHHFHKIRPIVQEEIEKKGATEMSSGAEGMHEAILDIVKAFQDLKNKIF
jgi:hypothetical protein